jgi:hypothetical protein
MPRQEPWNSCLLIHAHGFRPEGGPLVSEIDDTFWFRLVQQGWAVGVTSYRRTGLIVADAIKDINNLRGHVCNEFGYPYWVFLDGRSMGGAISVRIAEQLNARTMFSGVMAIGAALMVKEDDPRLKLTYRPTIPIVFLTNTSEIGPINSYIEKTKSYAEEDLKNGSGGDEVRVPALHLVTREGHNWTNPRERWRAFSTLVEWAFVGSLVTEYLFDGTKEGSAKSGEANLVKREDGTRLLTGSVLETSKVDSDLRTNITVKDLFDADISLNSHFKLSNSEGKEIEAVFGAYPFVGISDDTTVASEDPEGNIIFFDMSEFRNKLGRQLVTLSFNCGDKVILTIKTQSPRARKRLGPKIAPIVLTDSSQ